jgi:hypothetical protein
MAPTRRQQRPGPRAAARCAWPLLLALWAGLAGAQWLPIAPEAVPPVPASQAASWPAALSAGNEPQTRSLGLLLRLVQPKPSAETPHWPTAAALRGRVAEALVLATPAAWLPLGANRFVEQPGSLAATLALQDTITAALEQASHGPQATPAEQVAAETKGLLRALHDTQALDEARRRAQARRQGWPGPANSTGPEELPVPALPDIESVRLQETPGQATTLWLLLKPRPSHPQGLVARVNLDEVLAHVSRRAP